MAWVGEQGPELMRFRGGEQVMPAGQSRAFAARQGGVGNGGGGVVVNIYGPVNAGSAAEVQALAGDIGHRAMVAMRSRGVVASA